MYGTMLNLFLSISLKAPHTEMTMFYLSLDLDKFERLCPSRDASDYEHLRDAAKPAVF